MAEAPSSGSHCSAQRSLPRLVMIMVLKISLKKLNDAKLQVLLYCHCFSIHVNIAGCIVATYHSYLYLPQHNGIFLYLREKKIVDRHQATNLSFQCFCVTLPSAG